ncbi:MAG TPA: DegT/DnrJ/EryC1/StrS family aminotransferase [Anaerolineales bacterium]|nr:DegT/DnrJ/EryC1/StrS family aminotransferase [Anaerolineales bacterium]
MNWRIPLSDIDFGCEEISAVEDVLKSRWLTMGGITQKFEAEFAAYTGAGYALAVTNATAALHMACMAIGLKPGDEAIVPSLTFVASANAIRYTGATPVFADIISESDFNISADAIEALITERTRAIMLVHFGGYACDMPRIMQLAREHDLKVIEDSAHATGSWLNDRHLGTWGDIGCFSFFSNKNMTTGEGGMVVTNDPDLHERLRLLRSHGMTALTWDRHKGRALSYDVVELGYNYRIDEIRAALGVVQLNKLDRNNERRRHLTNVYRQALHEFPQIRVPFSGHPGITSAHILPILLPHDSDRIAFMERMKSRGIQTSIHYPPIHHFTSYKSLDGCASQRLPMTEDVASREVTLPLYPAMVDDDVALVVEAIAHSLI